MSIYFVWSKINWFLWFTLYFSYYFWSFFLYLNYSWSNNKKTLNYCVHSKAIRMRSMRLPSILNGTSFVIQQADSNRLQWLHGVCLESKYHRKYLQVHWSSGMLLLRKDAITDVKFSPLGNQLASASKD